MISRVFAVHDTGTLEYFLVTVFEEVDRVICDKIGISPDFKIINRLSGRVVDSSAGYRFDPEDLDESIAGQSRKFIPDGTCNAFGLLLTATEDIRHLPDEVSVEQIRKFWVASSRTRFLCDGLIETIETYGANKLRKCLYSTEYGNHIALIDVDEAKVIYDASGSRRLENSIVEYLWIPVKEADSKLINSIEQCVFVKHFIKPADVASEC
jgi:hypothetical protein